LLHSPPRREFELPEEDVEHLTARGLPWETVRDGGSHWLLLHEFCVPPGYAVTKTTTAIQITPNYPDAQLDMVYFHPAPTLQSGRVIGALSSQSICGVEFQRWSRHRTPENPWRPGIDNLHTHLSLVEEWLVREVNRG
jgi:hypothetical protein